MKARVKSTGVLVDVIPRLNINSQHSRDYLYVCDNIVFRECELDFLNLGNLAIDWEQRRYELAKSAMQGILSDINQSHYACSEENYEKYIPKGIARLAIACADVLINELKGE
jgi:hypothetical protein